MSEINVGEKNTLNPK